MIINSDRLHAFYESVRLGSFTAAAKFLHISQPSLSKRIALLEEELQAVLLIRTKPLTLTERGREIYDFCLRQRILEDEVFGGPGNTQQLTGFLRIAGMSSIIQSTVMPLLAPFLREHPHVQVHFIVGESSHLSELLNERKADFVFLDHKFERPEIEIENLGYEEMILIESTDVRPRENVYLDTGPNDPATSSFFRIQEKKFKYTRSFVHDNNGLLIGAALGLGRSVIDRKSVPPHYPVKILTEYKSLKTPPPPPPDPGHDWYDNLGRKYDAMGDGTKAEFQSMNDFRRSIDSHLRKGNDFTVIDLTGYEPDQVADVKKYVDSLPLDKQAMIRRIGF